jgi:hypothetical protein
MTIFQFQEPNFCFIFSFPSFEKHPDKIKLSRKIITMVGYWPEEEHTLITGRGGPQVQVDLMKVYHGYLQPNGKQASIIVADFKFIASNPSQHIVSAVVSFSFADLTSSDGRPIVQRIAPKVHSIETPQQQITTSIMGSTIFANPKTDITFRQIDLRGSMDTVQTRTASGQATLVGRIRVGRSHCKDTAKWDLTEDSTQRKGVPTCLRTAILLRRGNDDPFLATVEIQTSVRNASASSLSSLTRSFGRNNENKPMIFNPIPSRNNYPDGIDLGNLENLDLGALVDMTNTSTSFSSAVGGGVGSSGPQGKFEVPMTVEADYGSLR